MVIESIPKFLGLAYGLVMVVAIAGLWYSGRWRQTAGRLLLVISTALGFLIFSPMVPIQFQSLVLRDAQKLGAPLAVGLAGLFVVWLLALVFGRFFCGYLCPVGAIQEIAYLAPVPKVPGRKRGFQVVRAGIFLLFLLLASLSISLLAGFGIGDLFSLTLTTGTAIFCGVLLVSTTLYRPFCRLVCPYGTLLSLAAGKSLFSLGRTEACIGCNRCVRVCPTDEAGQDDRKAECYLCGRCTGVCPVAGALRYRRRRRF
jgi:polyferredoxin